MYPGLAEYMGLELSDDVIRQNMPEYLEQNRTTAMIQLPQVIIFHEKTRENEMVLYFLYYVHFTRKSAKIIWLENSTKNVIGSDALYRLRPI